MGNNSTVSRSTFAQSTTYDATIGSEVDVTLSGGLSPGTLYGYNLTDPDGTSIENGFISRNALGTAYLTFAFPHESEEGIYDLEYWVVETLEYFLIEIDLLSPISVSTSDSIMVLGSPFTVTFGLIDDSSEYVDVGIYEFWIYDPTGSTIQNGTVVSSDGKNATIILTLSTEAMSGFYRIDYRPVGATYTPLRIPFSARTLTTPQITVTVPTSPQVGSWLIGLTIRNLDGIDLEAELSILVESIVIVLQDVVLHPGDNVFTFSPSVVDLDGGGSFALFEVLLRFGDSATPTPIYQGSVLITSSWQILILIILLPGLLLAVPITDYLRRKRIRRSHEVVRARKLEEGDDEDKSLAFDLYRKSGFRTSAIRIAITLGLPEDMLVGIIGMGTSVNESMRKVGKAYDDSGDFETAARVYRHLNLDVDYRRTSILSEIKKGDLASAAVQFVKLAQSGNEEPAIKLIVNLHDQDMADEALFLCLELGANIRRFARIIKSNSHHVEVFKYLATAFDDPATKLNFLCDIDAKDDAAVIISETKTLKKIVEKTNFIEISNRSDIINLVIAKLAAQGLFKRMKAYIDALNLSDEEQSKIITPIAEELLNSPDNKNLKKFLKDAAKTAAPETRTFIHDVLDASDIMSGFGGRMDMEISMPYVEALLKTVEGLKNVELATRLLKKVHKSLMGDKSKITELSDEQLADYSQHLRATSYGSTDQIADLLKKRVKPLEETLRPRIKTAAKDVVKDLPLNPEEDMQLVTSSNFLTRHLVEDLPQHNPTVMAQTFYELTKIPMFPQLRAVIDKALKNENYMRFVMKVLANPELRRKLVMASQRYERVYGGYRITVDRARMDRITRDMAVAIWTERIHNVWVAGLFGALDTVVFNAMTRDDVPKRQKMLLVAAYVNRVNYAPDVMEGLDLKETFKRKCDAAGFTREDRKEVLNLSKLPGHVTARIRY
jgi:hypothetical protein